MEVLSAFWIPESAPLLMAWLLLNVSSSSSVGSWLVAESSIIQEFVWAEFPADLAIWLISIFAW